MNRNSVTATAVLAVLALSQFLLQPDNLTVWGNQRLAGVVLGAIAVLAGVVQNQLPRAQDRPGSD